MESESKKKGSKRKGKLKVATTHIRDLKAGWNRSCRLPFSQVQGRFLAALLLCLLFTLKIGFGLQRNLEIFEVRSKNPSEIESLT